MEVFSIANSFLVLFIIDISYASYIPKGKTQTTDAETNPEEECLKMCQEDFDDKFFYVSAVIAFSTNFLGGLLQVWNQTLTAGFTEGLLVTSNEVFTNTLPHYKELGLRHCENKCKLLNNPDQIEMNNELETILKVTKEINEASQTYQKYISDMQSSEDKFYLKDAPKLVQYSTVVNRIAFLSRMFLLRHDGQTIEGS